MNCFLTQSSIGKKLVMSISGCCLVLFILFHMSMNLTAIISPEGYNMICELLGANWYALVGTAGLAAIVVLHFVYALVLTVDNYRARGNQRYEVTVTEKGVSWASKNMLVLGYIILGGLCLHLFNFWAKMQLVELIGDHTNSLGYSPADGAALIRYTFSKWYFVVPYLVWFPRRMVDVPDRRLGQRHVVSPPEGAGQHRSHARIPRLRRRRRVLLRAEPVPLLRQPLLIYHLYSSI